MGSLHLLELLYLKPLVAVAVVSVVRVANCTLWFLKPPHIEANEELIYSVKILGGSSSVLELLETIELSGGHTQYTHKWMRYS